MANIGRWFPDPAKFSSGNSNVAGAGIAFDDEVQASWAYEGGGRREAAQLHFTVFLFMYT